MLRLLISPFLVLFFFISPALTEGQTITGPDVRISGGDIHASFSLSLEKRNTQEIKDGIEKEFNYYIDLFRIWNIWPDEFISGALLTRTLRVDPIKKEYVATSFNGKVLIERRFRSFESMLEWVLTVKDVKVAETSELDPGRYFVRVTVESKIRKLPPVIGHFLIFISENEFKRVKDSRFFEIESSK